MNKILFVTFIVFVLASLLADSLPRHLNPQEVPEELPLNIELLTIYSSIINAIRRGDFILALEDIYGLGDVYVPETLRYIYLRFNELLDKQVRILNQTKTSLDNAENELSQGLLENARKELGRASRLLAEAELTYNDLSESCEEFSRAFKIPTLQLSDKIATLKELIEEYRKRLRDLLSELERLEKLAILDTFLTLYTSASEVPVGTELFIFGTINAEDGSPLPGKTITIYLDGQRITTFVTDRLGFFSGFIKIPYLYKPTVLMFAEYVPNLEDRGKFRSSRSNVITLRLIYKVPTIMAWLNASEARPLDSFEVYGQIIGVESMIKNVYISFLDASSVANVSKEGFFRIVLNVPEDAPTGRHKIIVYTKPQGAIAPASRSLEITIYKINTLLITEIPKIVLACYQMKVHGRVIAEVSEEDMRPYGIVVSEVFDKVSRMVTSGDFSFNISVPCHVSSGYVAVRITYIPGTPIYEDETVVEEVMVINLLAMIVPVPLLVYLTIVGVESLLKKMKVERPVMPETVTIEKSEKVSISEGEIAEIVRIYLEAVHVIEDFLEIEKRPSDTIREFLDRTGIFLGEAALAFEELSYMTEAAVYGGVEPDLVLARYLLNQILRWLT